VAGYSNKSKLDVGQYFLFLLTNVDIDRLGCPATFSKKFLKNFLNIPVIKKRGELTFSPYLIDPAKWNDF
jgi:hypothetical protein